MPAAGAPHGALDPPVDVGPDEEQPAWTQRRPCCGTGEAWVLTTLLLGGLPVAGMLVGTVYGVLYLAFAVAVLAAVSGFTRSQPTTVFAALAILLALPLVGLLPALEPWLPSELLSAVAAMVDGARAGDFARSVGTAVVATAGLLCLSTHRFARREL